MRRYRGNVVVQEQAAKMMRSLAEMNERNKAAVREEGGVGDLVEAMRIHKDHTGLQKEACGALGSLARLNDKNKQAIARQGGIQVVVDAMDSRNHIGALEQACWAIRNLAANNENNKRAIAQAGGIEKLVAALRCGEAGAAVSAAVCEQACAAVGNLATNPSNRQAFGPSSSMSRFLYSHVPVPLSRHKILFFWIFCCCRHPSRPECRAPTPQGA